MAQDDPSQAAQLRLHMRIMEEMEEEADLDRAQRAAVREAQRIFKAIVAHPDQAAPLLAVLEAQERLARQQDADRHAKVIWPRVDAILRQAVKSTYDLGRVSAEMVAGARTLGRCAHAQMAPLSDPHERVGALDRIEAAAHPLRTATKALSGATRSILRVDHEHLGRVLDQWTPIDSAEGILACFAALGFAWDVPLPAPLPARPASIRC